MCQNECEWVVGFKEIKRGMKEKKRIFGYDALKVLAAFLVVLYHTGMLDVGYREGVYYYPNLTQIFRLFCACGVPLFFMVNGALTVRKGYDLKKTAVKAARSIFVGFFWGLVMQVIVAIRHNDWSAYAPINSYYWFMYTLAILYVVSFLFGKLPVWCRWCAVAFLLIFPFGTNLAWDIIILRDPSAIMPKWGHVGFFTLYSVVYLYLGDYLRNDDKHINKWLLILPAAIGLALLALEATAVTNYSHVPFDSGNYCFPTFGALLLSVALFVWVKDLRLKEGALKRYISFLADNSLGIYIFHLLLLATAGTLLPSIRGIQFNPAVVVLIVLVNMTVSAGLSELLRRTPLRFLLKL